MNTLLIYRLLWTLILATGIILRTYDLSGTPPGFFADEAAMALNAHSVMTTGKDAHGVFFPVLFEQFGSRVGPILVYSMTPFLFLLGPTVAAARLTAATISIAALIITWMIGRTLFPKQRVVQLGLFLIVACAPWGIKTGRVAGESSIYVFFLSLTLLFYFLSKRSLRTYLAAWIAAGITAYTYYSARIQMPLVVFGMMISWKSSLLSRRFLLGLLLVACITAPLSVHMLSRNGMARLQQMGGFHLENMVQKYLGHFSPDFLFLQGDGFYRNHIEGFGLFYRHDAVLFFLGVITILAARKWFLLWCLFVVYPLPGMVTADSASDIRSMFGYSIMPIVMAYGIHAIMHGIRRYSRRRLPVLLLSVVYLVGTGYQTVRFADEYFHRYALYAGGYCGWQYGFPQILTTIQPLAHAYDDVLITHQFNGTEELLAFHTLGTACPNCRIMTNPITIDPDRVQLFVLRKDDIQEAEVWYPSFSFRQISTVHLPDGTEEFFIGQFLRHGGDLQGVIPGISPGTDVYRDSP